MAELAHGRHTKIDPSSRACMEARGAIFNAALIHFEGLEVGLREPHENYDTLPHEVKREWPNRFRLHVHGLKNERHRRIFVEKYQVEPEQIEALNIALWRGLAVLRGRLKRVYSGYFASLVNIKRIMAA